MKAFFGKQEIKDKYVTRMKDHIKADELIQGTGYEYGKGCFIGCTLNQFNHRQFEIELNIPIELAYLFDRIFERLEIADAKKFSLQIYDSVGVGADTSDVGRKFKIWLMDWVLKFVEDDSFEKQRNAILEVKRCLIERETSEVLYAAAAAARAAAYADADANAAARSAAYAAAYADAAARSAATAARDATAATAATAAATAAARAAYADDPADADAGFWIEARDKLLELLKECSMEEVEVEK